MNKEKVYIEGRVVGSFADTLGSKGKQIHLISGDIVDVDDSFIIESIKPQKIKIPQFVADYIEFKKENNFHVYGAMRVIEDHHDKRVPEWFYEKNIETFARAWFDGYEVEEKRYLVTIKGIVSNFKVLKHNINEDTWYMSNKINYTDLKAYHTKKELEDAGFGWVFDCPGVEVEEVK